MKTLLKTLTPSQLEAIFNRSNRATKRAMLHAGYVQIVRRGISKFFHSVKTGLTNFAYNITHPKAVKAVYPEAVTDAIAWVDKRVKPESGRASWGGIETLMVLAIMAVVIYILLANLWPSMQSANTTIQGNTATDTGTETSKIIFNLLLWLVPVAIGVALVLRLFKHNA